MYIVNIVNIRWYIESCSDMIECWCDRMSCEDVGNLGWAVGELGSLKVGLV